jgi:hypothetical protein
MPEQGQLGTGSIKKGKNVGEGEGLVFRVVMLDGWNSLTGQADAPWTGL